LRLGLPKSGGFASYAHCQTSVIQNLKKQFPGDFVHDGTRATCFAASDVPDASKIGMLIRHALTYHWNEGSGWTAKAQAWKVKYPLVTICFQTARNKRKTREGLPSRVHYF
jgi:hypothetical protein